LFGQVCENGTRENTALKKEIVVSAKNHIERYSPKFFQHMDRKASDVAMAQ
jgi:hypothetical protein